ncbi:Proline-rich nuclear receptor coactivator [Heracleum sosnowskyi]|uniref:Proline-rich nuclear receptor coactivator n=1 Tax=Heracleum sosnowskyi TaxID=360622 RepID=A0AAD8LX99_9APIA|nr:Proline-rich nuclear receptor coactivator [Heracleum sosnowskyi]
MGTEVLRPQDCIRDSPAIFNHRKNYYRNGVPKVNRKTVRSVKPENRRKSPEPKKSASDDDLKSRNPKIVLGQVTILRRGESLDTKVKSSDTKQISKEMTVYGTGRLGPDPKMVTKQVRFGLPDTYAGSAFFTSPAPSALPLPSFFKKDGAKAVDDSEATRDLRRLLRLD